MSFGSGGLVMQFLDHEVCIFPANTMFGKSSGVLVLFHIGFSIRSLS